MIRTAVIVATVGLTLTVVDLSGCGIRGPPYMPKVLPASTVSQTTDLGIADPNAMSQPPAPGAKPAVADAVSAIPTNR